MKKFAVIGDPINHSLSPQLLTEVFRQLRIKANYQKHLIPTESLSSFMLSNGLDGFNVTLPHKEKIIDHLTSLDSSAAAIGAVNCVFRNVGYNTDWIGFLRALKIKQLDLRGRSCLLLGAGGAARSVAHALITTGSLSISVLNRSKERGNRLLSWIKKRMPTNAPSDTIEVVINCTPVGMWPDTKRLPMENSLIDGATILIDTIYNPIETEWLKRGRKRGATTLGGLEMLIAQGLASTDIWFGDNISEKIDIKKIRQIMESALC